AEDFGFWPFSPAFVSFEPARFFCFEALALPFVFKFFFSASSVSSAVFIPAVFLRTRARDSASQAFLAPTRGAALRLLCHSADFLSPPISARERCVRTE